MKWRATGSLEVGEKTAKVTVASFGYNSTYSAAVKAVHQAQLLNVLNGHWAIDGENCEPHRYRLQNSDRDELDVYVD